MSVPASLGHGLLSLIICDHVSKGILHTSHAQGAITDNKVEGLLWFCGITQFSAMVTVSFIVEVCILFLWI
jgi:hypothetical protein